MKCHRTIPLGTVVGLTLFVCGIAPAEVIISEIMYNPDEADLGPGFNKEWVEIFNTGNSAVDLGGWFFEDIQDGHATAPIPGGTLLDPGEALVLTGDFATFDAQWGRRINRIELGNFPTLANSPSSTNEILAIKNSVGVIQDIVNYDDQGDWPTDISDGPSISLLPDFLSSTANNDGTHWRSSTPGIEGAYYSQQYPFGEKASPGIVATEPAVFPPFSPSPGAAWSIVVFGDTQNYVKTQAHLPLFVDMAEWVRENRDDFNIQVVLHEGDIVNRNNNENPSTGENPSTLQWQNARATMGVLDGVVPYIMATGNHDYGINDAEDRTTRLNEFFSASDNPLVDPAQGGILKGLLEPGRMENAYFELTAPDGRELLIFSLGWDPQTEHLGWANQVAGQSKYDDHTAVLLTHSYLEQDGTLNAEGETWWNEFVNENGNFEMTFNGHVGGDGTGELESTGEAGNRVHQMVFNTQFEGNGGNGWIRVLEFMEDGRTVRVRTFSPTFGFLREDPENAFFFELSPLNPADFDGDGDVDGDDFLIWQAGFGHFSDGSGNWDDGDADGDGDVDGDDFLIWQSSFGTGMASAAAIPEPSPTLIAFLLLTATMGMRQGVARRTRHHSDTAIGFSATV